MPFNTLYLSQNSFPKTVQASGVRRVSVLGEAERRRRSILVYNRSGYFGDGDGSVSTSSAKHGSYEGSISLKQHFALILVFRVI